MGGSLAPVRVAGFRWNGWQSSAVYAASRVFSVGNEIVEVRHVAESKLRWKSRPEGELLRSLTVTPANSVNLSGLKKAISRLKLSESESRTAIRKLKSTHLPEGWHAKLEQFEREMMA
jgi:hypothetical protein